MVTRHWGEHEVAQEMRLRERAKRYGFPLVAATEVLYHTLGTSASPGRIDRHSLWPSPRFLRE